MNDAESVCRICTFFEAKQVFHKPYFTQKSSFKIKTYSF